MNDYFNSLQNRGTAVSMEMWRGIEVPKLVRAQREIMELCLEIFDYYKSINMDELSDIERMYVESVHSYVGMHTPFTRMISLLVDKAKTEAGLFSKPIVRDQ